MLERGLLSLSRELRQTTALRTVGQGSRMSEIRALKWESRPFACAKTVQEGAARPLRLESPKTTVSSQEGATGRLGSEAARCAGGEVERRLPLRSVWESGRLRARGCLWGNWAAGGASIEAGELLGRSRSAPPEPVAEGAGLAGRSGGDGVTSVALLTNRGLSSVCVAAERRRGAWTGGSA